MKYAIFLILPILACFVEAEEFGRWVENPDCIKCVSYPEIIINTAKVWVSKNIDHKSGRNNFTYNVFGVDSGFRVVIDVFSLEKQSEFVYSRTITLSIYKTGEVFNVVRSKGP